MSSSRSETAQSSWAQDNRRVIGEGGVSAENSTVNVLDNGAINAAFGFAGDVGTKALAFAEANGDRAFGLAGQAMDQVGAGQARVLDFGADALSAAFDFGRNANTQAQNNINATASLVKNAYEDAKGRGAMTDYILMGAILLAGLVAWGAVKK